MKIEQPAALSLPSFLYGSFHAVQRATREEGYRHVDQYQKYGTLLAPLELVPVPFGELVVAHEVVDFNRERPAWRMYMVGNVIDGLCEALHWQNSRHVSATYEAAARQAAWGALYFVISQEAPKSAERTALRLQALSRFWEPLQSARYLYNSPDTSLSLEELMVATVDWAMEAWCPVGEASVRARLEAAAERMALATKDDCIKAILREMPRALKHASGLKQVGLLADTDFLRQRLTTLNPKAFERISGACTADLLAQLYAWDRQLEQH
jgi:hypothetical protein